MGDVESIVVGVVRVAHCHEVLLAVSMSKLSVVSPVETPVPVRVRVILCVRVVKTDSVTVSMSVCEASWLWAVLSLRLPVEITVVVGAVRVAHCHEVLLAVGSVETPVPVRVSVIL